MPNETEQFLQDIDKEQSKDAFDGLFTEEVTPAEPSTQEDEPEEVPDEVKNRRHRRLESKLQKEREANIALAARLEALAEASRTKSTSDDDEALRGIERIYGTDTPEAAEATRLLKETLKGIEERAVNKALSTIQQQELERRAELQKEESALEDMIAEIEDTYSVVVTPEVEKKFFKQLEKLSPKDQNGNIIQYADHHAVWEYLASTSTKAENPAKKISARSMTQSSSQTESKLQDDVHLRYLRENGLI